MSTPKRYQFDNPLPAVREPALAPPVYQPVPLPDQHTPTADQGRVIVQHIHQAPPDRTLQRVALGAGMGGGAIAVGVYFGPLLVGVLSAMAANLAVLAFVAAVSAWGVVTVVRSIGGPDGKAAVKTLSKARKHR